jgi:hypothetical protein
VERATPNIAKFPWLADFGYIDDCGRRPARIVSTAIGAKGAGVMKRLTVKSLAVFGLALAFTAVMAEAQAQSPATMKAGQLGKDASKASDDKNKAPKANDKAYDAALKNLPNKQYDPWHGVR